MNVATCQSQVRPFYHWGISQMIRDHLMELLFHKSMCRSPWISPLRMRSLTSSVTPDFTSSVEGPGSCSTPLRTSPAPGSAEHLTMAVWDMCLELGSVPHRCVCVWVCGCGCVCEEGRVCTVLLAFSTPLVLYMFPLSGQATPHNPVWCKAGDCQQSGGLHLYPLPPCVCHHGCQLCLDQRWVGGCGPHVYVRLVPTTQ